jgi:ribosomal-protein-alanine N-acetyltransferase
MIEIRPCNPADFAAVQDILLQSPEAASWFHVALGEALASASTLFLVAVHQRQISGFIIGRRAADEAEILNLAVRPDARRLGLGAGLVRAFLDTSTRRGAAKVFLEVRESNSTAVAFYQSLGFQQIGRRPGYYSAPVEAALVLARSVAAGT